MKRYTYQNGVEGSYIMPITVQPILNFVDMLYLDREGVGIRLGNSLLTGDIVCDLYELYRMSYSISASATPGYFFKTKTSKYGDVVSSTYTLIGGNPTSTSNDYYFLLKGVFSRYKPIPGDSVIDVVTKFKDEINSKVYPYTLSATSSGNSLTINVNSSQLLGMYNIYSNNYQFEYGLYTKLSLLGKESDYLISLNKSNVDYPTSIPPTDAEYALTTDVGDINSYIKTINSHYYRIEVNSFYNKIGTVNIKNIPNIVPTTSSAVYDQPNSQIIFSDRSAMKPNENFTLIYR